MLVAGLILAVVASPANAGEQTEDSYYIQSGERRFYLNAYWGRREEVLNLKRLYEERQSSVEAAKG